MFSQYDVYSLQVSVRIFKTLHGFYDDLLEVVGDTPHLFLFISSMIQSYVEKIYFWKH